MDPITHCEDCGRKLVKKWNGKYNRDGGEKQMIPACPNTWCTIENTYGLLLVGVFMSLFVIVAVVLYSVL